MKASEIFAATGAVHRWSLHGLLTRTTVPIAALALVAILSADSASGAMDTSALLRFTSNYEYRGYTLSDNHPALQANVDIAWSNRFFLGTWASTANFGGADLVVNPYLGKSFDLSPNWQIVSSVAGYFFDAKVNDTSASYAEGALLLAYHDIGSIQVSIAPDYYGTGATVPSFELELRYPLAATIELSGGLGYQASRSALDYDGIYSNVGIAWFILPRLTIDLRYHGLHEMNQRPYGHSSTEALAESHLDTPFVLSVSIGL